MDEYEYCCEDGEVKQKFFEQLLKTLSLHNKKYFYIICNDYEKHYYSLYEKYFKNKNINISKTKWKNELIENTLNDNIFNDYWQNRDIMAVIHFKNKNFQKFFIKEYNKYNKFINNIKFSNDIE
ncbi:MAG: hypothetical protein J6C50_03210 [Rickettsiales bacterium]|nr:hypothetical protein [Rickettsiales bacterium]